ncbi:uncharacterized protein BDCG_06595 [Blastomyces dermatitidis ER-3]|uniref:Uncharacterized protein n=1 Tax=Ajellomyces dermatitidis (strain ER-3 / ATCC MYA-2586) TaxID=559297 RepID=A0ABP2F3K5_AJEDR|nr:uncharacterized protein BDCG_06595 [Blastomyces dermatitidis ER-3]EEQ91475.1 hypothetical protein BDCG_06595 [Blastomyces dermatitidis ER-3]
MTTSFHYQSPRVEEDTEFLDLNLPNVAFDDFSCMPQFDTYPTADCESIDLSKLDHFPLDSSLWDNFNPDLFASSEPSIPLSTSALNDICSTDFNSLPDPSSIWFDTLQMGHASPNLFSPDSTFPESALPSPDLDDSTQRLNWVKSTLKDLALARAAKDTRPVSQRTKQIDASIELYLQLQNDISSGFLEDCNPSAQSMVWQHSSTTLSDSSFDTNSFSVTGSPGSSTGTVPELSPAFMTRAGSASAGPSRTTLPPATGGVEMVLDMNLNETTSLPRKHRPKTHEERQRYIAVRRQGACEWHRKQRKRCTCVDKTESAITTVKRKKLMKHVQNPSPHCSGAILPLSSGDRWRRTNVRPSSGPLESSSPLDGCPVPKITWQCHGERDRPFDDSQCLGCCGSEEPTTPPLIIMAKARSMRQVHKPIINRGTLQLIERQSPIGSTDCDPRHVLQSHPPNLLQTRTETQAPIPSRPQNAVGLPGSFGPVQDLHIHIIASPGQPSSSFNPHLSGGIAGDTPIWPMLEHSGGRIPDHRRVDAAVSAPAWAGDRPRNSRLNVVPEPPTIRGDVESVYRDGQSRATNRAQTDDSSMAIASLRVVRLILRTILRLATRSSSLFIPCSKSRQPFHSIRKTGMPHAVRNRSTSHSEWREPSTTMSVLLLAWGCLFVSPIMSIVAFILLPHVTRNLSKSNQLSRAAEINRICHQRVQGDLSPTREQCGAKIPATPTSIVGKQATVTSDREHLISRLGRHIEAQQSNSPLSRNMPSNFDTIARIGRSTKNVRNNRAHASENSAVACPDALMALSLARTQFRSHHDYPAPIEPNSATSSRSQQSEKR